MKTSKLIKNWTEFNYVKKLPANKWYTEHCAGEIQILKKAVYIVRIDAPHFDIKWFDEFGDESSNADNTYDPDDYDFYRIVFEYIDLFNEKTETDFNSQINYGSIESDRKEEYIYTDKYIEYDIDKFEHDIKNIVDEVRDSYDIEEDHYYGDCYSDDVNKIKSMIEVESMNHKLRAEEYRDYLSEIRTYFDSDARYYLDNLNKEMQEENEDED